MTNNTVVNVTVQGRDPVNGLAVAGLIFGIIGASFAWVPILGVGAWLWVLPGGLMSAISLGKPYGRGTAIAGCIANGIGLLICFAYLAAFGAAIQN